MRRRSTQTPQKLFRASQRSGIIGVAFPLLYGFLSPFDAPDASVPFDQEAGPRTRCCCSGLGDFYELFYDDALVASRELQITLTSRNKEKGQADSDVRRAGAFGGRLHRQAHRQRVIAWRSAIRWRIPRRPRSWCGARSRASSRRARPATRTCCAPTRTTTSPRSSMAESSCGLAYADISTGEFRMTEMDARRSGGGARAPRRPRSVVCRRVAVVCPRATAPGARLEVLAHRARCPGCSTSTTRSERSATISSCTRSTAWGRPATARPCARPERCCTMCATRSARRCSISIRPNSIDQQDWMALDLVTVRNLELVEPLFGGPQESTLLAVIDKTETSMGARLLRQWLSRPSLDRAGDRIAPRRRRRAVPADDLAHRDSARAGQRARHRAAAFARHDRLGVAARVAGPGNLAARPADAARPGGAAQVAAH